MARHAGLSFSDILRQEISRFGVKVSIIEMADIRAQLPSNQLERTWNQSSDDVKRVYQSYETVKEKTETLLNLLPSDQSIDDIVKDIIHSIVNLKPKANYKPNCKWQFVTLARKILPTELGDFLVDAIGNLYDIYGNSPVVSYFQSSGITHVILEKVIPRLIGTYKSFNPQINIIVRNRTQTLN